MITVKQMHELTLKLLYECGPDKEVEFSYNNRDTAAIIIIGIKAGGWRHKASKEIFKVVDLVTNSDNEEVIEKVVIYKDSKGNKFSMKLGTFVNSHEKVKDNEKRILT